MVSGWIRGEITSSALQTFQPISGCFYSEQDPKKMTSVFASSDYLFLFLLSYVHLAIFFSNFLVLISISACVFVTRCVSCS